MNLLEGFGEGVTVVFCDFACLFFLSPGSSGVAHGVEEKLVFPSVVVMVADEFEVVGGELPVAGFVSADCGSAYS